MATFQVRKDGSGTHTTIQGAIVAASSGDIIDVGAGTFIENLDIYKNNITIIGAGKDETIIQGVQESSVVKPCTWALGATTISCPGGTAGFLPGRIVTATGFPANTRIVLVGPNSFTISAATTAAKSNLAVTQSIIESTARIRGDGFTLKNVKVIGVPALVTRASIDNGALYFRTTGLGAVAATHWLVENCEITANGDSAIMTDNTGPGAGVVQNCLINGKTFVGDLPAQVHAFSQLPLQCNILTTTTIEIPAENLVDVKVGSPILTVTNFVQASTTVSAISGNVLTLNKALLANVGTTQTITFTNIQFNVGNVARQLVVFQPSNTGPTNFINNTVMGTTGGGISYNTAVTVDAPNSVVTGNTFNGMYKEGYALRVRGVGATVENNVNTAIGSQKNAGYLIGPTGAQFAGMNIGTNTSLEQSMIQAAQTTQGGPIKTTMQKALVKNLTKVSTSQFADDATWKLVTYVFKKVGGSQRIVSSFRDYAAQKSIALKAGMQAGDQFQLVKMIISKADKSFLIVKRSEIDQPETYDFTLI